MKNLEVKNLCKSFGKLKAVDDISFKIESNSIFGLLGRNGAGKTTTIRMMLDIYKPDEGEILFNGLSINDDFKNNIGYLPEERGLYKNMKVLDTLLYLAELKDKKGKKIKKSALEYLEKFELLDRKNSKIEDLSKGNQQKVQFISTIIHDPDLILLDEPFSGLDPVNIELFVKTINDLKQAGKIIILSTHLMDFAEKLCTDLVLIDNGKIIFNGSINELKSDHSKNFYTLTSTNNLEFLKEKAFVKSYKEFGNSINIELNESANKSELLREIADNNVDIIKFDSNELSLHEIFINLTN